MAEVNWAGIQPHYQAGILPLREIAKQFGITHAAIRKHAEKEGWSRNLNTRIQAKAEEILIRQVSTGIQASGIQDDMDTEIIDANANRIVAIKTSHRKLIERLRLATECAAINLEEEVEPAKQVPLLKTLSETVKNLIGLEREAYGIDKSTPDEVEDKPVDTTQLARKVAFILAKETHTIQ